MKNLKLLLILILIIHQVEILSQLGAPTPPSSICYNYDKAGNRIAQNTEWISLNPDIPSILCQPNNPENYIKPSKYVLLKVNVDMLKDLIIVGSGRIGMNLRMFSPPIRPVVITQSETSSFISQGAIEMTEEDERLFELTSEDNLLIYCDQDIDHTIFEPQVPDDLLSIDSIMTQDTIEERASGHAMNKSDLQIIPNPNLGRFRVEQKGFDPEQSQILIIDNKGTVVFDREFINGEVHMGHHAAGTYILILKDKQKAKSVRFEKRL